MPLPATSGQFRTNIGDMNIGDFIAYKAVGTSGVPCTISDIGAPLATAQANEIPVSGSANPNGYAYGIKNDKGMMISDRPVQHSVSWDALNNVKLVQGKLLTLSNIITSDAGSHASYPAINAFDSDPSTKWLNNSSNGGHWIKIHTGNYQIGVTGYITSALLRPSECGVKNWKIYGSVDDITYIELSSGTSPNSNTPVNFTLTSSDYTYFRLNIIDSYGGYGGFEACVSTFYISGFENIKMTNSFLIRSLTGGNAYLGTDGKSSLTDKGLGAFPPNNEWDKFIVGSNLGGKIIAGDDNVWHWNNVFSLCQDTFVSSSSARSLRGFQSFKHWSYDSSSSLFTYEGFRPVFQFLEPNSKASNLFY